MVEVTRDDDADYTEHGRIDVRANDEGELELVTHEDIFCLDEGAATMFVQKALRELGKL